MFFDRKTVDFSIDITQVSFIEAQRLLRDFMTSAMADAKVEPASVDAALQMLGFNVGGQ